MTTDDGDTEIRQRVGAAMEALPRPDRGRLARIEQGLQVKTGPRRALAWLVAAAVAAGAAAAGAAYWAAMTPPDRPPEQPDAGASGAESANPPDRNAPSGDGAAQERDETRDPVIYQR